VYKRGKDFVEEAGTVRRARIVPSLKRVWLVEGHPESRG
jgi:predicted transcriptional regulator